MMVSCIMPTANRRQFLPHAIGYFLAQDYPEKELLILDDGQDHVGNLVPKDSRVRYFREEKRNSIGLKRNTLCELAQGELIAHFDDDDWYAPNRLSEQVATMTNTGADLSGLRNIYFYDVRDKKRAWMYIYSSNRPWVYGPTMIYTKKVWQKIQFEDVSDSDDTRFAFKNDPRKVKAVKGNWCVATLHENNTAPKNKTSSWKRISITSLPGKISYDEITWP